MNTINYIEAAKKKLGITSDYAIAKELGMSKAAFSRYKTGGRVIDDYTAAKLAEVLGINALEVIAAANAEREKDSAKVAFWRRLATGGKAASLASVLIVGGFFAIDQVLTFNELYIMRSGYLYVILAVLGIGLTYKLWESHHAKKGPF